MRGDLPLHVAIDNQPREAHSTYTWAGGGMVLTISTVIPEPDFAVELISTYVGHPHTPTIATHLMLGPVGQTAEIRSAEHPNEDLDPVERARDCAYDHADRLIESMAGKGHRISVRLDEGTFVELERVE